MAGFIIVPNEERDLSRYRCSDNQKVEKQSLDNSSKIEEFKNEIDEVVRQFQLDNAESELRMQKAFEEADRKYEDTTRSIHSKYPDLKKLGSKYPDLNFYIGI